MEAPRAMKLEWLALGLVVVATVSGTLIKVDTTDTPWHLATARMVWQDGESWPATNTFSHTHPDYPLYQQYPVYQSLLWLFFSIGGWSGLSVLTSLGWLGVLAAWIWWAGGARRAAPLVLFWAFACYGLKQRWILCPDILTVPLLVSQLVAFDVYRRGRRSAACALVVTQWTMANTHQLFVMGLAVQGVFVGHLVLTRWRGGRWGIDDGDRAAPIWPIVIAFTASICACLLTPLGTEIRNVIFHTLGSVTSHRGDVMEFLPIFDRPHRLWVMIVAGLLAMWALWTRRRSWLPFELGMWLIGLVSVCMAVRGLPLFTGASVAIFARAVWRRAEQPGWQPQRWIRVAAAIGAIAISAQIIDFYWIRPTHVLMGQEAGLGKHEGTWPTASLQHLREHPPEGPMLNLTWYSGNALVWTLYPERRVMVDPRFEAYPRKFLQDVNSAARDDRALDALYAAHRPTWIVAEIGVPGVRGRLTRLLHTGHWWPVVVDPVFIVLVHHTQTEYVRRWGQKPETMQVTGWSERPEIRGLQQVRVARLFGDLGMHARSDETLAPTRELARRHMQVALELVSFYKTRGGVRYQRRNHQGALDDFGKALDILPDDVRTLANRASVYYAMGAKKEALADFDHAIRVDPGFVGIYLNRAKVRMDLRDWAGAVSDWDHVVRHEPMRATAYEQRGIAHRELDQLDQALADFGKTTTLEPKRWQAWVMLAEVHHRKGDDDASGAALKEARKHVPPAEAWRIDRIIEGWEKKPE